MTIQPRTQVLCRQITDHDLDGLADLLARGFPRSDRGYWLRGFERWKQIPVVEGIPRYGYVLDTGLGLVGALLLISSQRGGQIIANTSSWYVEQGWRSHSTMLASVATSLKHVIYINASPAPHTWRSLQMLGCKPYNFGRSAVFALPGRGAVSEDIPADLPEAQLLRDHRAMGLVSVTVKKDGIVSPFVLLPRRLERPSLPMMDILFCRGPEDFRRCAPALARHFLPRGRLGFLIDGRIGGLSVYVEGKERRYFKGAQPPILGDLAYTEKVIFG